MATNYHNVFVYGTLKRNEPNHHWITDISNGQAKYLGIATTEEKYPLVIASRYNIPYLINASGLGHHVEGEIYEVDDVMLLNLDVLEDHPKYYERKIRKIKLRDSGEVIEAWIYLLHKFKDHMLQLPFLKSYQSQGEHGLKYVARYLRDKPGKEYWSDVKKDDFEDDISDPDDI